MVMMTCAAGMGDASIREWLPRLWRRIEDAHYSYLETDDSPAKLQQKKKLEDYIMEYLSRAPHDCKFRLAETNKVFQRTVNELPDFNAYRAGIGWAAIARYAGNLLTQPWRKEYRVIRLYSGFFKHEVEANMVGAETLLHAMGYVSRGAGRLALVAPPCPDTIAAVSRDALVAHCECQIMVQMWEAAWGEGGAASGARGVTWGDIYRARTQRLLHKRMHIENDSEIYSNVPTSVSGAHCDRLHAAPQRQYSMDPPPLASYPPNVYMYPVHPEAPPCQAVPLMTQYVPYYYPVQTPYMIPTPVYPPIKHAANVPLNGYPPYRYPSVPTGQLIELEAYEDKKSRRNSTSKSGFSDVTLPSLPRSDTQPVLSAREDGMGTYESWDYVFRNLSSKNAAPNSPSLDRDSKTLERLDKPPKARQHPTTLDLEDGLRALSLDHRLEEINKDLKKAKQSRRIEEKRAKRTLEPIANPKADALITPKIAPDKVKLLSKKEIKERKDVIKQQNSVNGVADLRKVKKSVKSVSEVDKKPRHVENGTALTGHSSKTSTTSSAQAANIDLKAQLIVSLDETDSVRRSPPRQLNGDRSTQPDREKPNRPNSREKWECYTCTYINKNTAAACEMCGKSKKGPEIQPLTSGGRECPACTLVNPREARVCDACGTSLDHCPTYI